MTREEEALERARGLLEAQGVKYDRHKHLCPHCSTVLWLMGRVDPKARSPLGSYPVNVKCNACGQTVTLNSETRDMRDDDDFYATTNPWKR